MPGAASEPSRATVAAGLPQSARRANGKALTDPIALVEAMWNHRSQMLAATASKGVEFPQLSAQDLTDMLVYLRNLPGTREQTGVFRIEAAGAGETVFQSAGCAKCHQTVEALAASVQGKTLTEIAAEMWNHAPRMAAAGAPAVHLAPGQMRDLVSSFWAAKFFEDAGRPGLGQPRFRSQELRGLPQRRFQRCAPPADPGRAISAEPPWFPRSGATGRACWIR